MRMDISWALKQTVQWRTQTGEFDQYAQPIMKSMGTIPARVIRKVQLVKNIDGVEVASSTQVHVTYPVEIGDEIIHQDRVRKVISAKDGIGLYDSKASFYVLYL